MLCSHEYFAKGDAETVDARDDREVQPPLKFDQYEYFILCLNTLCYLEMTMVSVSLFVIKICVCVLKTKVRAKNGQLVAGVLDNGDCYTPSAFCWMNTQVINIFVDGSVDYVCSILEFVKCFPQTSVIRRSSHSAFSFKILSYRSQERTPILDLHKSSLFFCSKYFI